MIDPVGHPVDLQGIGIMYRVIDTPGLFRALKNHNFGGQTCKLKLTVRDSFYPKHAGSYLIDITNGRATVKKSGKFDVEIVLDVAEYSSMIMGVVPFDKLYEYKLADISDPKFVSVVSKLFASQVKPMCVTHF